MSTVRQYELIYITPPETTEEALAELHQTIVTIIEKFGATIENTEAWGRRRLAYEIAGHREGVYVLELINGPAAMTTELDRRLRVMDIVIRHLIVRVDEDYGAVTRSQARRKADMAKRRVRRGLPPEPTESEKKRHQEEDDDDGMGMRDMRDMRDMRERGDR